MLGLKRAVRPRGTWKTDSIPLRPLYSRMVHLTGAGARALRHTPSGSVGTNKGQRPTAHTVGLCGCSCAWWCMPRIQASGCLLEKVDLLHSVRCFQLLTICLGKPAAQHEKRLIVENATCSINAVVQKYLPALPFPVLASFYSVTRQVLSLTHRAIWMLPLCEARRQDNPNNVPRELARQSRK